MILRILLLTLLPLLSYAQINSKEAIPKNTQSNDKGPVELKRNALYNLDEIKVRWKKAALENCMGVPCVTAPSFTCGTSTVSDIDNNVYNTVTIGTQCWIKENLKVTKYNDNTAIPLNNTYTSGTVSTVWQGLTTGAYTIYGNESSTGANATNYGFLYNWYAATDSRKICPTGWHVPTDSDWNKLVKFIHSGTPAADTSSTSTTQSTTAGGKMKSMGTTLWNSPNTGADNSSGFSALPGGYREYNGSFNFVGNFAYFWSATESASNSAWRRALGSSIGSVIRSDAFKTVGYSVRCLRD